MSDFDFDALGTAPKAEQAPAKAQGGDFDFDALGAAPAAPTSSTGGFVIPEDVQGDLNAQREAGTYDNDVRPDISQPGIQNKDDLYSEIRNDPKYQPLNEYLANNGSHIFGTSLAPDPQNPNHIIGGRQNSWANLNPYTWTESSVAQGGMPPELVQMYNERADRMAAKYANTGSAAQPGDIASIGGVNLAPPDAQGGQRIQERKINNPNFNPEAYNQNPNDPDNQPYQTTKYLVDPPEREDITRMGYQVLQNIVGGVGDVVNDLRKGQVPHFTSEGDVGKAFPETAPKGLGEKFADDMATFVIGPKVIGGTLGTVGKVASPLAQKAASMLTPSTISDIQKAYQAALANGATPARAMAIASGMTKKALVGMSFGLQEATVAPNDSQGAIVSPEFVSKELGVSPDRAKDISFALDTPVIAGTLKAFGGIYKGGKALVGSAVGGARNAQIGGIEIGKVLGMSDTNAGLKLFTWLDPNLLRETTPDAMAFNIKTMGDALERNSIKNLQLASVGKEVKMDTPAAFQEVARDYFSTAYASKRDVMGTKEFNDWVSQQSDAAANRLFQMRTALNTNDTSALGAYQIDSLFSDAADAQAGGSLGAGQTKAGEILGGQQINDLKDTDLLENQGKLLHESAVGQANKELAAENSALANKKTEVANVAKTNAEAQAIDAEKLKSASAEAEAAKTDANSVISNDPYMKAQLDQALSNNPFGTQTGHIARVNALSEPAYQSLKKMRMDTDAAYNKVADLAGDADGDIQSLSNIILTSPVKDDPFIQKIGKEVAENPSFKNIYFNVKNEVNKQIDSIKNLNDPRLDTLRAIRENIQNDQLDFLKANGDGDIAAAVDDAKGKYLDYINTWRDHPELRNVAKAGEIRMARENSPVTAGSKGQGVNAWEEAFQNNLMQHLDAADQGRFMDALSRGVKMGGGDIDKAVSNVITTKAFDNMAQALETGSPESLATLRSQFGSAVQGLEKYDPTNELLPELRRIQTNIETARVMSAQKAGELSNLKGAIDSAQAGRAASLDKAKSELQAQQGNYNIAADEIAYRKAGYEKQLKNIQEGVAALRQKANDSVLAKFVYKGDEGARPASGGTTANALKKIFNAHDSEDQIVDLLSRMGRMGERGEVAKDALKATYFDYLRNRLGSKQSLGPVGGDNPMEATYRISEPQAEKIFAEGSKDMNNLKLIFHDQPEVIKQLEEAKNAYLNLTRKTPKSDAMSQLTHVEREEDPQQALNSIITFTMGVLNPSASRARRLTAAWGAQNLEQVRAAKKGFLEENIGSAATMSKTAKDLASSIKANAATADINARTIRGFSRANSNYMTGADQEDYNPVRNEMNRLK